MDTSVFATILANSSKLILPSRSESASMIVLSTICPGCQYVSPCFDSVCTHLLQLLVLQVAPNHHLQHYEELAIADKAIAVNVVYAECEPQLLLLVSLAAECGQPGDEFLEVDVTATVLVKNGDHACCERVRGDLRKGQEFVALDGTGVVLALGQPACAIFREWWSRTLSSFMKRFRRRSTSSRSTVGCQQASHEQARSSAGYAQFEPEAMLSSSPDCWLPMLAACVG